MTELVFRPPERVASLYLEELSQLSGVLLSRQGSAHLAGSIVGTWSREYPLRCALKGFENAGNRHLIVSQMTKRGQGGGYPLTLTFRKPRIRACIHKACSRSPSLGRSFLLRAPGCRTASGWRGKKRRAWWCLGRERASATASLRVGTMCHGCAAVLFNLRLQSLRFLDGFVRACFFWQRVDGSNLLRALIRKTD